MPTRPASIEKALLRIVGTVAGALLAYLLAGWIAYDLVACVLALFVVASIGFFGMAVSTHGYAWLFLGITFTLVTLSSLNDPAQAYAFAVYRSLEVFVGIVCAILIATLLAPAVPTGSARPAVPSNWNDVFGAQWPAATYAMRGGVVIAALPLIWNSFDLPDLPVVAATVAAVMAVPMLPDHNYYEPSRIITKASYRLLGCFIGGVAGLVVLVLSPGSLLPWLALLCAGVWLFVWMQGTQVGAGYVGTQACVAYIVTLVQGEGPPISILPGIDRFAGIILGVAILLMMALLSQPTAPD